VATLVEVAYQFSMLNKVGLMNEQKMVIIFDKTKQDLTLLCLTGGQSYKTFWTSTQNKLICVTRNPYRKGRLSTFDLLVLTSLDQLHLILQTLLTFLQNKLP
jgi:hypothetical protein